MTAVPPRLAVAVAVALLAMSVALAVRVEGARAQEPEGTRGAPQLTEAQREQVLRIERQLLCPQCTNKRLDVCEIAICQDMRRFIQQEVVKGTPQDDIIYYFRNRYGDRVLAEIPKEGFNLVLFGWVGGSILLVAAAGTLGLLRLRAGARRRPPAPDGRDEAWLERFEHGDEGRAP